MARRRGNQQLQTGVSQSPTGMVEWQQICELSQRGTEAFWQRTIILRKRRIGLLDARQRDRCFDLSCREMCEIPDC